MKNRRAVFLDRDGVINRAFIRGGKPYPPKKVGEVEILPGVYKALMALKEAGYLLIVITNQPDVARGTIAKDSVEEINSYLSKELPLDDIRSCYHDDHDNCRCRKPLPGALLIAANEHCIDMSESFMIGDRWKDIEAGTQANCATFFIDYGYDEKRPIGFFSCVSSLYEAATIILENQK